MAEPRTTLSLTRHLAARLYPLSVAIGLLITFGLPGVYYAVQYGALKHKAAVDALQLSNALRQIVLEAPALWKYQAHRYSALLHGFLPYKDVTGIRVLDETGRSITHYEHFTESATAWWNRWAPTSSAPLVFNNRALGTVQVGVSQGELALRTLAFLLLSITVGVSLATLVYRFPVKAVRMMEEELQRQREARVQSEKLAAMGTLLAGVAHELNNPLSVVVGQAALFRRTVGAGPPAQRADKIARAAQRCTRIVRNFLALARQQPPERHQVALNQIVEEAVELLAYQLGLDNVEVTLNLAKGLPLLWADPHQLHQVVVNLISNAQQAMRGSPASRRLTLSTRLDSGLGRVSLEVADTGPGIAPEVRSRIFEPFFTTKAPGQGTGLGLSLCQGLVESHGGSIRVESEPGRGAIFVIELPVVAPPVVEVEAGRAEAPPIPRSKTILVVEDEGETAELLTEMLSADDHQVETAANGAVALDRLRERTYEVILTDIRMPMLDGPGLYRELERSHPGLRRRVIFITGDDLSPETREFLETTGALRLGKPFEEEDLRQAIGRVLRPSEQA